MSENGSGGLDIGSLMRGVLGSIPTKAPDGRYEGKLTNSSFSPDKDMRVMLVFHPVKNLGDTGDDTSHYEDQIASWSANTPETVLVELQKFQAAHKYPEGTDWAGILNSGELRGRHYTYRWKKSAKSDFYNVSNIVPVE